eukprot:CAMPEP_0115378886 /NCGR_PEP_ID=MMETSP0271-20121206/4246_1 /TAXON_ID=71861 /ORGANISM="Scrippsiella trochoidea, Strain CCMP3099" /LENGTH=195 /DNA_ID=CAMNT_0002802069 /DNA_START=82 /DNA_END=669 /DNA_ORIENTATION=+
MTCFINFIVAGLAAAAFVASATAFGSKSSGSQISFTRFSRNASSALNHAPVIMSSLAFAMPTNHGIVIEEPNSGVSPSLANGYMKRAFLEHKTISPKFAKAMFAPPPTAAPLMAMMSGFGKSQNARVCAERTISPTGAMLRDLYNSMTSSGTCHAMSPLSAAPELKARVPVAVQTTAFTRGSRLACSKTKKVSIC